EPILISKPSTLSAAVLTEINRLGATEVDVYSTNAVNVSEDLRGIGVKEIDVEEVRERQEQEQPEQENKTEKIDDLSEQVQSRAAATTKNKSTLVIVASANFEDALSVPIAPNAASFVVGNEEQITDAVSLVRTTDAKRIKVTGKPAFAQRIADRIEAATNRTVDMVSGKPEEVAAQITEENEKEWNEAQEERLEQWNATVRNTSEIRRQANKTVQKALNQLTSNASEEARELAVEAQKAFREGEYVEARNNALKALSIVNSQEYMKMSNEEVRQAIKDEKEGLAEVKKELKQLSREKAQALKEAETEEERLEIIQEFKEERKELRKERQEEQQEERGEKEKEGETETAGGSEVALAVKGLTVNAEATYKAPNKDFTITKDVTVYQEDVTFQYSVTGENRTGTMEELEVEASKTLQNGTYTISVILTINGKQVNKLSKQVRLPSFKEFENEIEKENETEETEKKEKEQENTTENASEKDQPAVETVSGVTPDKTITLTNYEFSTVKPSISAGTVIKFVNKEGSHTVTLDTAGIDKTLSASQSVTLRFNEDGTYQV
ncbi:MAG: hypothetical protein SVU32_08055, partial [Candidatus Nanohaloarchaea archaeon]|nr:hypothetical protein [Candidatus Nanohaloarchaea archaeon]